MKLRIKRFAVTKKQVSLACTLAGSLVDPAHELASSGVLIFRIHGFKSLIFH